MPSNVIPLGDWTPDQAQLATGAVQALNTIRTPNGYRPLPGLRVISQAVVPSPSQALVMARTTEDDVVVIAAGGDGHLYEFDRGALNWKDVSKAGGYPGATLWNFVEFGNSLLASTDGISVLQTYNMAGGGTGTFGDLSTSAPKARFLTLVRDQVFAGAYPDSNGNMQVARVGWSAIDDPTSWTPNITTLCDFQDNPDCGALMGLAGGSYATALFETTVKRITFIGPPAIYQFDAVLNSHGCMIEGSVVAYLNFVFYLSPAGFQMWDGNQVQAIGAEQVDRYFFRDANMDMLDSMRGSVDPAARMVIWVYAGAGSDGTNNHCIMFNYSLGKWSHGEMAASALARVALPGYTLDDLDFLSSSVDALQASLDSRTWAGGRIFLGAMDYGSNLCNFTGPPNQAVLDTAQVALSEVRRTMLQALYPLVEGDSTSVSAMVWSKGRSENEWRSGPTIAENAEGWIGVRREGRYHRVRLFIDGFWTHVLGVEYLAKPLGLR
jgi:hypothetical protein